MKVFTNLKPKDAIVKLKLKTDYLIYMKSVKFIDIFKNIDNRGSLSSVEAFKETGIYYKRFFLIENIKGGQRGGHAHKNTDQILKIIKGSMNLYFKNLNEEGFLNINENSKPIFLPKLTWIEMNKISSDAIILVLSSDEYNMKESLREKNEFLEFISNLK